MRAVCSLLLPLIMLMPLLPGEAQESEGVLNQLLAPGPLMGGHRDLEGTACFKCHDAGKGLPVSKCLDCHKEIRRYVEQKRSLHGITAKTCIACHSDHKGRDYDSISVDPKTFDHKSMTGYPLEGKHSKIRCEECHTRKRSAAKKYLKPNNTHYFGAATDCKSCHRKDDVHFFMGKFARKDCNECHSMNSWKEEVKFNHDKDTRYLLEEAHAKLKCNDCHLVDKKAKKYKYEWPKLETDKCLSCHKDFHTTKLSPRFRGGDCLKCHDQTRWKIEKFDHGVTKYPLRGKHADLNCVDCHKQRGLSPKAAKAARVKNFDWTGLKTDCLSCHKDFHKFGTHRSKKYGNMNQCLKCHDETDWKRTHNFTHDEDTRYAIDGKHLELKCADCHMPSGRKNPSRMPNARQGVYEWPHLEAKNCENCHQNPHIGKFKPEMLKKRCDECHVTRSWVEMRDESTFDHSKTRFPLSGAHTLATCKECHLIDGKMQYKFRSEERKFCIECHSNVHAKQFSSKFSATACSVCHTTTDFTKRLTFDHAATAYKLEGSHSKVACEECHKPTGSRFDLRPPNISKKAEAAKRTPAISKFVFRELAAKQCLTCHADFHKGQLGNKCQTCHNVSTWKKVDFDHNRQSAFPLEAKHTNVDCAKCHLPIKGEVVVFKDERRRVIRYKPLGKECLDCHKDPHKGQFGTSCAECHNVRGWQITKDFHKNFTLRGVHFALECAQCHRNQRKLGGSSPNCILCHQKDDIHHGTLPNCRDCHNQDFWEQTSFRHSMSRFPLRGAHRTLDCGECHFRTGSQAMYQGLDTRCESCHREDAVKATSQAHTPDMLVDCQRCHRNSFSFRSR